MYSGCGAREEEPDEEEGAGEPSTSGVMLGSRAPMGGRRLAPVCPTVAVAAADDTADGPKAGPAVGPGRCRAAQV